MWVKGSVSYGPAHPMSGRSLLVKSHGLPSAGVGDSLPLPWLVWDLGHSGRAWGKEPVWIKPGSREGVLAYSPGPAGPGRDSQEAAGCGLLTHLKMFGPPAGVRGWLSTPAQCLAAHGKGWEGGPEVCQSCFGEQGLEAGTWGCQECWWVGCGHWKLSIHSG